MMQIGIRLCKQTVYLNIFLRLQKFFLVFYDFSVYFYFRFLQFFLFSVFSSYFVSTRHTSQLIVNLVLINSYALSNWFVWAFLCCANKSQCYRFLENFSTHWIMNFVFKLSVSNFFMKIGYRWNIDSFYSIENESW